MSDTPTSTPPEPGPAPRALARHLGLQPPLRWLPQLAATQTKAFGLYSRNPGRTSSTADTSGAGRRKARGRWAWRLWVALACVPTLCELTALRAVGWLASTSTHALTELRPLRPTAAERARLTAARLVVFLVALPVGVLAASPAFLASAALHAWWPSAVGYAVVLLPVLVDQGYRARSASTGATPAPDLPPGHTAYLVLGFCADPQDCGWGSNLAARLFTHPAADPARPSGVTFVLRARTERLIGFYARFGFRLTDPDLRLMVRPTR